MDIKQYIITTIEQKIHEQVGGLIRRVSGNRLNFRCPLCGDSTTKRNIRRGWYFLDNGLYKCYNEGCIAFDKPIGAIQFYATLTNQSYEQAKQDIFAHLKELSSEELSQAIQNKKENGSLTSDGSVIEEKVETEYELRETWVPIEESEIAMKFLEKRKVFSAGCLPKGYKFYFDFSRNKIVLPWFRDGKMMSYQYRTLDPKDSQKYTFPINCKKDIFGLDNIDHDFSPVFYTEGVLDAIFVQNCLAIGGIHPSESQLEIMQNYLLGHELVFFPDNPWIDASSKREIIKFAEENPNKKIFIWELDNPYKDINEEMEDTLDFGKYMDKDYLLSRIRPASMIKMCLLFNRDII